MKILPIREIGKNRPLCATKIHVAQGLKTIASRRAAYWRERKGIPIDQCGVRADFLLNGAPICRAHAGQAALNHLLTNEGDRN